MAPTHVQEEIEGRYKEYAYSPVPTSCTSTVYYSPTLGKYPIKFGGSLPKYRTIGDQCPAAEMTEKGSTLLQYLAAAAGKFQPFFSMAKRGRSIRVPGLSLGESHPSTMPTVNPSLATPEPLLVGHLFRWRTFHFRTTRRCLRDRGILFRKSMDFDGNLLPISSFIIICNYRARVSIA